MPLRIMLEDAETLVMLDWAKVATSERPFGTVAGVQFAAVFQLPLVGLRFQVALPANNETGVKQRARSPARLSRDGFGRRVFISSKGLKEMDPLLAPEQNAATVKRLQSRYI
jgi:hypothetical protein